jgi:AraC family transcriptional regulator
MERLTAFQEIQDTLYSIERYLTEPLDINAMAAKVHLTPYYFQRLFSRLVGRPIADYQRQRRLARSLEMLRGNERILDIALHLGFHNHETFTRAFKAAFGIAPGEYRNGKRIKSDFDIILMPDVTMQYNLIDEDVPLISDGIILEISRRTYENERLYAGFRTTAENPGSAWCLYQYVKTKEVPFLHPHGEHAGISLETEKGYNYLAGYQVSARDNAFTKARGWPNTGGIPDYLSNDFASLPPGEYLVCTFTAEDFSRLVVEAMYRVIPYLFGTFIKKHKLEICGPLIEIYDERCLRWHPGFRIEDEAKHLENRQPKLSNWEGPEMEIQIMLNR